MNLIQKQILMMILLFAFQVEFLLEIYQNYQIKQIPYPSTMIPFVTLQKTSQTQLQNLLLHHKDLYSYLQYQMLFQMLLFDFHMILYLQVHQMLLNQQLKLMTMLLLLKFQHHLLLLHLNFHQF